MVGAGLAPALEDRPHLLKFALMGLAPAIAGLTARRPGWLFGWNGGACPRPYGIPPSLYPPNILFHPLGSVAAHTIEGREILNARSADCPDRAIVLHQSFFAFRPNARNLV
jgi:hypothetical protein